MNEKSPVMAILPSERDMEFGNQIAISLGFQQADIVIGSPREAVAPLSSREESPRYLIIDIGDRGSEALADIDALAEYCDANVRVVVIGSVNDVHFYRALRGRGVIEYFPRPVKIADVRTALLASDTSGPAGGANGKVITFMGAASGDGASTVALNTAYTLAQEYRKSVVLVDMDYQFGMIAKNLDLTAPFGIKELFEHPDRGIDVTLIKRMIVPYGTSRLHIIAAPNQLFPLPEVRTEAVRDLIGLLRRNYDIVILDLPHIWTPWVATSVVHATHAVVVAQLWLRSATHSTRLLATWRAMGVQNNQISLIVNRSGAKFKEAVSARDFERICGIPIRYYLLNDIKTVMNAENQGKTIIENSNSALSRQFKEFAGYFNKE